jgi:hypothetical protein
MAEPTLPYTLTNGTTADASQVQGNDQALLDGITDGTKDIEVAALTTTGNCTFGNSSADSVTCNGSLSSHIVPSANTTYDLGSSTLGLRSVYIGGSSTYTCRVLGGTQGASYTLTVPTSGGTTGQFPVTDGAGTLSFRYPDKAVAVQTSTYAATGSETVIPVDGTSAFTVTLPAVASYPYKRFIITRIDQTLANAVTIARAGSDTFTDYTTGLTSLTLMTRGESIELINDGTSVWYVVNRHIPGVWTSYTPTTQGFGTPSGVVFQWRRDRGSLWVRGQMTSGTVSASQAQIGFPAGLTSATESATFMAGNLLRSATSASEVTFLLTPSASAYFLCSRTLNSSGGLDALAGNATVGSSEQFDVIGQASINGWSA